VRVLLAAALLAALVALPGAAHAEQTIRHWRFQPDPDGRGVERGWHQPTLDDVSWQAVDLVTQKEERDRLRFDGVAWYRGWLGRPARTLVLFGIDTPYEVFVDGAPAPVRRVLQGKYADRMGIVDLGDGGAPDRLALVAVRVAEGRRWEGALSDARAGDRLTELLSAPELLNEANRAHPDWLLPSWVEEWTEPTRRTAWTMVGLPAGSRKALLTADAALSPRNPGLTVTPWLRDERTGRLHAPHEGAGVSTRLRGGYLPIVEQSWRAGALRIETTTFVSDGPLARQQYVVTNEGAEPAAAALYLAVRPYDVRSGAAPIETIGYAPGWQSVVVDGQTAVRVDRPPDGFGAGRLAEGDVSAAALRGELPGGLGASDPDGYAMGLLRYRWQIAPGEREHLVLTLPVEPVAAAEIARGGFDEQLAIVERGWRERLDGVQLRLPEPRLVDAFRASLAYLLIAQTGDRFHPGPLLHNASWTRDTAYIALALSRVGMADRVRPALERLIAAQRPSGEFPAIVDLDGTPRPISEWDAQGQAIFALTTHAAFTGDRAFLAKAYPAIRRAAEFVARLRASQAYAAPPARGILPPSLSAEDIGSETWHHYWDDFWALAGLREAAGAARALGQEADAARWRAEEESLRRSVLASIRQVQQARGVRHVPNGPEDVGGSSDARGTNPAIWPVGVLPGEEALLRASWAHYFDRWIEPRGGGYRHALDLTWPYGGLGLAQGFLRLGMTDRLWTVLDWTMRSQTLPGAYAWAEGVHPDTLGYQIGDMPHGWAASELINLLRDVLLTEQGDRLVIGAGVPRRWLLSGREIAIENAPTPFGPAGYSLTAAVTERADGSLSGTVRVRRLGPAAPPGGYRLALPDQPTPVDLPADFAEHTLSFG
jgi:hypothetical protein